MRLKIVDSAPATPSRFCMIGTGGGVLQKLALLGKQVMLNRKRRQSRFVKAAQDEFFLAGIRC